MRALRRCGLKDKVEELLQGMTERLIRGRTLERLRAEHRVSLQKDTWPEALRSLLQLSEVWLAQGWEDKAIPFLDDARSVLTAESAKLPKESRLAAPRAVPLACSYLRCLGQLRNLDTAVSRMKELLRQMAPIPNTSTTNAHYSFLHLSLVENLVLALVSDEFTMGHTARRWLDDDEYLVRRRIHHDMKSHLAQSGL
jgi:hypothetical protein